MTYLSSSQLQRVQQFLPLYLEGQTRIGVPWALLAAIHYRESNFNTVASRVGGAFQFDPPLPAAQVRAYGAKYGITDLTSPETDVRTGALCSAAFLQAKAAVLARVLTPDSPDEVIADTAFSYNGRAAGYWKRSSYVANDPQNGVQLRIVGTMPDEHNPNIRVPINQPDTRPGVMAVIRELRVRVALPTAPVVIAPAPAPVPAQTPMAVGRLLLADPAGRFGEASDKDLIYSDVYFSRKAAGGLWAWPARLPVPPPPAKGAWLLLADQGGKFVAAEDRDFVYQGLYFSQKPNGDLWIRPATTEEQKA